jgi:flagellar basal body-associated protein FliL
MTETEEQPTPTPAPKRSSGVTSLMVLALVGLLSGAAGFATPYVACTWLGKNAGPQTAEAGDSSAAFPKPQGDVAFVPFDEVIVNLNDGRMSRYLRLKVTLQVDAEQQEQISQAVERHKVILKDSLLRFLSDQGLEEIRGAAGQNRLRREILDQFNSMLFPDGYERVHDVLFEEFNVQ